MQSDSTGMQPLPRLRLGLIGGNIRASRSPALHRAAGRLAGLDTSYDLLIPDEMGLSFEQVLADCSAAGYRGVNVTYPFKERVVPLLRICDPLIAALRAVNTVVFETHGMVGHNTDYSGFISAYRDRFGAAAPGKVVLVGAGGVGRAIAFGLVKLGAAELRIVDRDMTKAADLAGALAGLGGAGPAVVIEPDVRAASRSAEGILNCTPVGMVGSDATPVPDDCLDGVRWAFDAVYTPVETRFKTEAEAAGVSVLSGYELFFHQGVDAFGIFTGTPLADPRRLRGALLNETG
ncbi:shikimate dehydrogenase [Hoeflea marina]|uniref:Shikimate dehydrogenase n=1 Tax=Hoeflea marina TaxID=274592 RepID=A0A317PI90_9HYPH|nr:shikimate dehydrogenase [Hoeflea marina]PWW00329.1 shikimate dehydrogenase [Hoeflea marina]